MHLLETQYSLLSVQPGRRGGEKRNLHLLDLSQFQSVNVGHTPSPVEQLFIFFLVQINLCT